MQKKITKQLAAALVAALGLGAHGQAVLACDFDGGDAGSASDSEKRREGLKLAKKEKKSGEGAAESEGADKGKDKKANKGKEGSCKGKEGSCKGKGGSCSSNSGY